MRIIAFDTETTGLIPKRTSIVDTEEWPHIVQLSWIIFDLDQKKIVKTADYIIKCAVNIPEESTKIHKITNKLSEKLGIPIKEAIDLFEKDEKICDKIVAHNLEFDKLMIMVECERLKYNHIFVKNYQPLWEYCTMKESTEYCNIVRERKNKTSYVKYPSLTELYVKLFGIKPTGVHNSLVDSLACLRCYLKYKHNIDLLEDSENKNTFHEYITN